MAKGNRGGKRANGNGGTKYLSPDKVLYESSDEVLYVERMTNTAYGYDDVLDAQSDGNGNITLGYATPVDYYQQNSKTSYGLYELKCGVTNASDIHGSRVTNATYGTKNSKVKSENDVSKVRSVGIDWDKVNSVSGQTYNIKALLKAKGFKWNSAGKNWVKS